MERRMTDETPTDQTTPHMDLKVGAELRMFWIFRRVRYFELLLSGVPDSSTQGGYLGLGFQKPKILGFWQNPYKKPQKTKETQKPKEKQKQTKKPIKTQRNPSLKHKTFCQKHP